MVIFCLAALSGCLAGTPPERHQLLNDSLRLDEFALTRPPQTEPLTYLLVREEQRDLIDQRSAEMKDSFADISSFDGMQFCMQQTYLGKLLVAKEEYASYDMPRPGAIASAQVSAWLDGDLLGRYQAGDGSPLSPLQGLWVYDRHWVLEYAHVTAEYDASANSVTSVVTGKLVEDGVLLNDRLVYEEAFGFQLMRGRPFYFYKQAGSIGAVYDGQVFALGYDHIPHYACCSAAALNPRKAHNMVTFFAQRGETWYLVQMGVYEP